MSESISSSSSKSNPEGTVEKLSTNLNTEANRLASDEATLSGPYSIGNIDKFVNAEEMGKMIGSDGSTSSGPQPEENIETLLSALNLGTMTGTDQSPLLENRAEGTIESTSNKEKARKTLTFNELPRDMHRLVLGYCTKDTRKALSACSHQSREIVNGTQLYVIKCLTICYRHNRYALEVLGNPLTHRPKFINPSVDFCKMFETVEERQVYLTRFLKEIDCINRLKIENSTSEIEMGNWSNDFKTRVRVERVEIVGGNKTKHVLSQLEPMFLQQVDVSSDDGDFTIYDTPQVIQAKLVHVGSSIRESQLLSLEACHLVFKERLSFSLQSFVENCVLTADTKPRTFEAKTRNCHDSFLVFYFPDRRYGVEERRLLETAHPQLKFELLMSPDDGTVKGSVRYATERIAAAFLYRDESLMREITTLEITYSKMSRWTIGVSRSMHAKYRYNEMSIEKIQGIIDELIEVTDNIRTLIINIDKHPDESGEAPVKALKWKPKNRRLLIAALEVKGNFSQTSIQDLLKNSALLKVKIWSDETETTLYDIPQLCDAKKIILTGSVLRDDQLLKINSTHFENSHPFAKDKSHNASLTSAGINQYLKKCLLMISRLEEKSFYFYFADISPNISQQEIFTDIGILSRREKRNKTKVYIATADEEYVFKVKLFDTSVSGEVVLKKEKHARKFKRTD